MKGVCIYESNAGLGACDGPIEKIRVASKRRLEWKGLEALKERLAPVGEEPGVCKAHEKRAEENGYLHGAEDTQKKKRRSEARPAVGSGPRG